MIERIIEEKEAGQRLDKFLRKYLPEAGSGFYYKMLRKKNITLNGRKAEGNEKLVPGDKLCFYMAAETIAKFQGKSEGVEKYYEAWERLENIKVLYENAHILIADKPAGVLSQKADAADISLNEWLIGYLLKNGAAAEELSIFKPSVCNRLDRNTSGMVICAKTLSGSQEMSRLLKSRELNKFYRLYVKGKVSQPGEIRSCLTKDMNTNRVKVDSEGEQAITRYEPLQMWSDRTLLEAVLVTGKSHQIRVHLASIGHPLIGDFKYGDPEINARYQKCCQADSQLLHAYRLEFPRLGGTLAELSGLTIISPLPEIFNKMKEYP